MEGLSDLKCLETLNLRGNRIEKIAEIEGLRNLKTVNLSYNKIQEIDDSFKLENLLLEQLDLQGNKICKALKDYYLNKFDKLDLRV